MRLPDLGHSGHLRLLLAMECLGTGSHNNGNASTSRASTESASSRSDLFHRRIIGKDMADHRPGSALAQRLVGSPLPLIKCDGCPWQVLRRVSTTPQHPGWVFIKCEKDKVHSTSFDLAVLPYSAHVRQLILKLVCRIDASFGFGKKNTSIY